MARYYKAVCQDGRTRIRCLESNFVEGIVLSVRIRHAYENNVSAPDGRRRSDGKITRERITHAERDKILYRNVTSGEKRERERETRASYSITIDIQLHRELTAEYYAERLRSFCTVRYYYRKKVRLSVKKISRKLLSKTCFVRGLVLEELDLDY